jgi:hypothetical protein
MFHINSAGHFSQIFFPKALYQGIIKAVKIGCWLFCLSGYPRELYPDARALQGGEALPYRQNIPCR